MSNTESTIELIPSDKHIILESLHKKPIRINLSWKHCLDDAYYLTLTGKTLVVNNIGTRFREDHICTASDLSYILQDIFYLSCENLKGIYTSNINIFMDRFYNKLTIPYQIDVISLFSKPINKIEKMEELDTMYENIFETLVYSINNHPEITSLVFVPIGCEGFGHSPGMVADLFFKYINRYSMGNVSNIIISCNGNNDNYRAFQWINKK